MKLRWWTKRTAMWSTSGASEGVLSTIFVDMTLTLKFLLERSWSHWGIMLGSCLTRATSCLGWTETIEYWCACRCPFFRYKIDENLSDAPELNWSVQGMQAQFRNLRKFSECWQWNYLHNFTIDPWGLAKNMVDDVWCLYCCPLHHVRHRYIWFYV